MLHLTGFICGQEVNTIILDVYVCYGILLYSFEGMNELCTLVYIKVCKKYIVVLCIRKLVSA